MEAVHDVFHRAMARAIEQSGSVETLHGDPAAHLLEAGGGMGAILRYHLPVTSEQILGARA
jgi:peptide subunit release factor 1 (eRF1)